MKEAQDMPTREEMIQYILENPDPGLTSYSRGELEAMGDSQLWSLWMRR